ncbi:MAG: DNA-binding NarL/FixJ family response regulator [Verrucomicrobiales bacterium]|jgi:DNA-binding NarL/FixJ family response regulator
MADEEIEIWIVEDHRAYREQLAEAIGETRSLNVGAVRQFGSSAAFLRTWNETNHAVRPEVILLDIRLPGKNDGLSLLREIRRPGPGEEPSVIMLTMHDDPNLILEALSAGASGYLLKSAALSYIVESIAQARTGGMVLHPEITAWLVGSRATKAKLEGPSLTTREGEVLTLLAKGLVKKQIADQLGISFHTVDGYLRQVYEKLEVPNKNAAVAEALRRGLISVDE